MSEKKLTVADDVVVSLAYTLTVDGEVLDSAGADDPLEYLQGHSQIIPGLDCELPGMNVGDKKSVRIEPDLAYGPVNPDAQQAVPRADIPKEIPLEIGTPIQVETPDGQTIPVTIAEVTDEAVVLDANHPLAGKALKFDIELVSIGE